MILFVMLVQRNSGGPLFFVFSNKKKKIVTLRNLLIA